ncbi:hypothetical protein ACIRG5_19190 [Lentzea sp. NPDC102401]|uniref:hypothetical protein n=1 Tax=Lentzea sp. NPDC102401 TaxID=3364128 RepID=UPI0037FB0028
MTTRDQTSAAAADYWAPDFALNQHRDGGAAAHFPGVRPSPASVVISTSPSGICVDPHSRLVTQKRGRGKPPQYVPEHLNLTADFAARLRRMLGIPGSRTAAEVARIACMDPSWVSRAVRGETLPSWDTVEILLGNCEYHYGIAFSKRVRRDLFNDYERAQTDTWRVRRLKALAKALIRAGFVAVAAFLVWLFTGGWSAWLSLPSPEPMMPAPVVVVAPNFDRIERLAPGSRPALPVIYAWHSTNSRELGSLQLVEVKCVLPVPDGGHDLAGWFMLRHRGWVQVEGVTARATSDITTVLSEREILRSVPRC